MRTSASGFHWFASGPRNWNKILAAVLTISRIAAGLGLECCCWGRGALG